MLAQLIPVDEDVSPITLVKDITLVGRKPGLCDLVFEKGSVSKIQCLLVKTDGLIYLRDLCSTNGTRVNGQKVVRGALIPGDVLTIGGIGFRIHLGPNGDGITETTEMMTYFEDDVRIPKRQ